MNEWQQVSLGDLVKFENGDRSSNYPKRPDYNPVGIPFVSASDLSANGIDLQRVTRISSDAYNRLRAGKFFAGDILYCLRGTIGKMTRVPEGVSGAIASSLVIIRTADADMSDLVYYFLSSSKGQAAAAVLDNGSAQPNLSVKLLSNLKVPLPPIEERKNIAAFLRALDDKIKLNSRMNETLEAMARAIFKDWFVDFGPTRAKMEGRAPYLAPEIWALFPNQFDDEGHPKGWRVAQVGDFFRLERGLSYKGKFLTEAGISMINLGCFQGRGRFDRARVKSYSGEYRPRHTVKSGDLVIANTDVTQNRIVLGSPHIVTADDGDELIFSHHVYAARARNELAKQWTTFLFFHLLQSEFRERAEGFATGTTVLFLPSDAVEKCDFVFPEERVNAAFLEAMAPMLRARNLNDRQSQALADTRDLLLPKLMSGEIRVCEAEKVVEAVT